VTSTSSVKRVDGRSGELWSSVAGSALRKSENGASSPARPAARSAASRAARSSASMLSSRRAAASSAGAECSSPSAGPLRISAS
jgi:hypothetical protein